MTIRVDAALENRLRQLGVRRVYGHALAGLEHVQVDDPDQAVLLADADGRIGHWDGSGRVGAALLDGPILHLSSKPGGMAPLQRVGAADELFDALAEVVGIEVPGTSAIHLDVDLDELVDEGDIHRSSPRVPVLTLDPSMSTMGIVLLVGPGLLRSGRVESLSELARKAGFGVVESWGAKGVERWNSPFHFGTVGLQDRDMELAGVADADVVVTVGLDPDEVPPEWLGSKLVQDVPPRQLEALVRGWATSRITPKQPDFRRVLSKALTPMLEDDRIPLSPARAALHLTGALPDRGVVVADPGSSGFWIARAMPTEVPGSVCVPATVAPGFAAAAAIVCALDGRPCISVTDQLDTGMGLDESTATMLELAERLGLGVALQLWGDRGELSGSDDHVAAIRAGLAADRVTIQEVPVRLNDTDSIDAALGSLVAWP